jgi:hypothetical protein
LTGFALSQCRVKVGVDDALGERSRARPAAIGDADCEPGQQPSPPRAMELDGGGEWSETILENPKPNLTDLVEWTSTAKPLLAEAIEDEAGSSPA